MMRKDPSFQTKVISVAEKHPNQLTAIKMDYKQPGHYQVVIGDEVIKTNLTNEHAGTYSKEFNAYLMEITPSVNCKHCKKEISPLQHKALEIGYWCVDCKNLMDNVRDNQKKAWESSEETVRLGYEGTFAFSND